MGHRCPECNRFGPGEGKPCRKCAEKILSNSEADIAEGITPFDEFKAAMERYKTANPQVFKVGLLEVSQTCTTIGSVPREKRNEILGIMGTRINLKQKKYVTDKSMDSYGMGYKVPGDDYEFVKNGYGCFRED